MGGESLLVVSWMDGSEPSDESPTLHGVENGWRMAWRTARIGLVPLGAQHTSARGLTDPGPGVLTMRWTLK